MELWLFLVLAVVVSLGAGYLLSDTREWGLLIMLISSAIVVGMALQLQSPMFGSKGISLVIGLVLWLVLTLGSGFFIFGRPKGH